MCFEAQSMMASVLLPKNVFLNEILDKKKKGKALWTLFEDD